MNKQPKRPRVGADVPPEFKRELLIIAAAEELAINDLVIEGLVTLFPELGKLVPNRYAKK